MLILFIADTHGELDYTDLCVVPFDTTPDCIIYLGDIQLRDYITVNASPKLKRVPQGAVLGNHDGKNTLQILHRRGLQVVDLNERMFRLQDVSFVGLSGALRYKDDEHFCFLSHQESVEKMMRLPPADIVISHDYPFFGPLVPGKDYQDPHEGLFGLGQYVEKHHPQYLFHGHLHENYERNVRGTQTVGIYGCVLVEVTKKDNRILCKRIVVT